MSGTLNKIGSTVGNVAGTASGVLSTAKSLTGTLSGALSALTGATGAMGGLADLSGLGGMTSLIAATLAEASFRGISFSMAASEDTVGRRVVQMFFPGLDDFAIQDLGALDGPIHIRGLICGDDYVYRAMQMRAALMQKGVATLVHPWWGTLQVWLVGDAARIAFDETRQGIATLEMTVVRVPASAADKKKKKSFLDSLGKLLDKADALLDKASSLMRQVLSPLVIGVSLARTVENSISQVSGLFSGLIDECSEPVARACATPLATLAAGIAQPATNTGTTYADAITAALVAVPAAIADAVLPASEAAVASATQSNTSGGTVTDSLFVMPSVTTSDYLGLLASGNGGTVTLAPTAQAGTALLIAAVTGCLAVGTSIATTPGGAPALSITLVAAVACATQALATAAAIQFASVDEAIATRDALIGMLDTLSDAVVRASAMTDARAAPGAITDLFLGIQEARTAVYADISSELGRLPSIVSVSVPVEMNGWALAYALAGDTVDNVVPLLNDLIIRNAIATPAIIPVGSIHVLEQEA